MTLVCGGELFTGNTCFLAAAVAENRATMPELIKNWSLSYVGNVIGALFMVWSCSRTVYPK
jgi:formate/nitrite transporter FocA (FNT family)